MAVIARGFIPKRSPQDGVALSEEYASEEGIATLYFVPLTKTIGRSETLQYNCRSIE